MTAGSENHEDPAKRIAYIENMLQQLVMMAAGGNHDFLAHLLEIARLEAESIVLASFTSAE